MGILKPSSRAGVALAALIVGLSGAAFAHYPLVETAEGLVAPNKPVEFLISSGHPFMNDRVDAPKVGRVGVYPPQRRFRDLTKKVTETKTAAGTSAYRLVHTPTFSGDWIYSFHCGETLEKPQRRVTDYVKLILHVRTESGAQIGWRQTVGDPLEIVPLTRPYLIPVGSVFSGKVVFNVPAGPRDFDARPMVEGVVEAESYTPDRRPGHAYLPENRLGVVTNDRGAFNITLPTAGWWMITVATDGGPGEQGLSPLGQRRAALWVQVGGTVYDRYPAEVAPAPAPKLTIARRSPEGKEVEALVVSDPKDLAEVTTRLQLLNLAEVDALPEDKPGLVLTSNHMWGLRRVELRGGLLAVEDDQGKVAFYADNHNLGEWLEARLAR